MLWNWYITLLFGPVGWGIKPPLGLSPFERHSLRARCGARVRWMWWSVHNRLDKRLGASRRAAWKRAFPGRA